MSRDVVASPALAPSAGPFSPAMLVDGFLYVSGQVGQDPATGRLVEGGVLAEAEQTLANLEVVLAAAGMGLEHAVRVGVYLTRIEDFETMNGVYARHFRPPYPARTTIGVAALPLGARVEIDLVAKA